MPAGKTFWFFGLSGAGKSTLADAFHASLEARGVRAVRLDGDGLRRGLNADLGFSVADRSENIRRAAEVARLFNEAGSTVIASFISPRQQDRALAQGIVGTSRWIGVFVDAPLSVCEARDPKGLYRKARSGGLPQFTGVSAEFEPPADGLRIASGETSLGDAVEQLTHQLLPLV